MALRYQGGAITSGSGKAQAGATALWNHLKRLFPQLSFGGIGRAGSPSWSANHSTHYEGRAIDMMVNHLPDATRIAVGNAVANFLVHHADVLGIQEITWNGWHWGYSNKWYWRPSKNTYAGGRPDHWNHVHVGINWEAAQRRQLSAQGLATTTQGVRITYPGQGSSAEVQPGTPTGPAGAPAAPAAPTTPRVAPEDIDDFIKDNYGYFAGFINDPEIGPILRQAASEGLSAERLYGRLAGTKWWQTHSDAQRKWEALKAEDPATAERLRQQRSAQVVNQLARIGLNLTASELAGVVDFTLENDFSLDQVVDYLIQKFAPTTETFDAGELGKNLIDLRQMEDDYLIDVPWQTMTQWAKDIASGQANLEGIRAIMATQARQRHGANQTLLAAIEAGGTPADAVFSQRQRIAELLEVDDLAIDFRDEAWRQVIETTDAADGTIRPMTDSEAAVFARKSDDWFNTDNARRSATTAGRALSKVLGIVT